MEFCEIQFDDSFIGGNWMAATKLTPGKCKSIIINSGAQGQPIDSKQLGYKGLGYQEKLERNEKMNTVTHH